MLTQTFHHSVSTARDAKERNAKSLLHQNQVQEKHQNAKFAGALNKQLMIHCSTLATVMAQFDIFITNVWSSGYNRRLIGEKPKQMKEPSLIIHGKHSNVRFVNNLIHMSLSIRVANTILLIVLQKIFPNRETMESLNLTSSCNLLHLIRILVESSFLLFQIRTKVLRKIDKSSKWVEVMKVK